MANRLADSLSPYLRQHAQNPVDWYPWGPEALEKARREDKPILVSIGYSACHWCHVMEHESFEDSATAEAMNAGFVNIKIDREERPDLDQIYMGAVQAMSGSGGWPLNVFLTPEARPFTGGTYFPPRDMPGRPAWTTVLRRVLEAFESQRERVEEQAQLLVNHLAGDKADGLDEAALTAAEGSMDRSLLDRVYASHEEQADTEHGGFGRAPKFPGTHSLRFLLRYGAWTGNQSALEHAKHSLLAMADGGIYDHLGGGFARYATDQRWLVPHFEKMLYDNALLLSAYAEAAQAIPDPAFQQTAARVVQETVDWVLREMQAPEGAFYATLDADSEGVEGKFYTWSAQEIDAVLGADAAVFRSAYGVEPGGNWEGINILHRPIPHDQWATEHGEDAASAAKSLLASREALLEHRAGRIRPGLDDKVILAWNALFCSGLYRAEAAFDEPRYRAIADACLDFLADALQDGEGGLHHLWQQGSARFPAFLDDYGAWIAALLDAYEASMEEHRLLEAIRIMHHVLPAFTDEQGLWLHYTPAGQQDVIVRSVDRFDGATPSGNALMAANLLRLGRLAGESAWTERGLRMLAAMQEQTARSGTAYGHWACSMVEEAAGRTEIAALGPEALAGVRVLRREFRPGTLFQASAEGGDWPLLQNRRVAGKTLFYVCRDYACAAPVEDYHTIPPFAG